jgi:hypothetical protein
VDLFGRRDERENGQAEQVGAGADSPPVAPVPAADYRKAEEPRQGMSDMGLSDFDLDIRSHIYGFIFVINFRLLATRRMYTASGTAPSVNECFDIAMAYLAQTIREESVTDG